jgi:predicted dehydrogenase
MSVPIRKLQATNAARLRLLVIGGGAIVSECHLPAMQQLGQSKHAAIVDISSDNLARLRTIDADVALIQEDFRQVMARPNLSQHYDAALITLPNALHYEAVALCFAAGLDVLCEKPLANTSDRCQKLAALAEQTGRKLGVAMVRRYVPAFLLLQDAIARGLIGKVKRLDVTHGSKFAWPANSGFYFRKENGGLLLNMGVHYVDQLQALFGPLTPNSACN